MLSINQILEASNGKCINGNRDYIVKSYNIDSRTVEKEDFFIPLVGKRSNAHDYIIDCVKKGICGYFIESNETNKEKIIKETIIINKDIIIIEVTNSKASLYEIGKLNRKLHMDIPVIAITGSVAKTTTREILSSVISKKYNVLTSIKNFNGDIGLPMMLLKLEDQELAILEHGIDYIGEMDKLVQASKPNMALVTMIGTAHIGTLGSKENIFKEKMDIAKYMDKNSTVVLNGDDTYLKTYMNNNIKVEKYYMKDVSNIRTNEKEVKFNYKIYNKECEITINTVGEHNIQNVLACIKMAEEFNIDTDMIISGISEFKNESGRFEIIKYKNDIQIIDDTYNANIDSMKAGINSITNIKAKRKIAVLGDMLELGEYTIDLHTEVGKFFENKSIDILYTLGENAKLIANEAKKYVNQVEQFNDKGELAQKICKNINEGDLIYFKASNIMNFGEIINEIDKTIERV